MQVTPNFKMTINKLKGNRRMIIKIPYNNKQVNHVE